ncbi:hypothetical protein CCP2SC5_160030 [Azospirillaceae bacterium]
MSEAFPAIQNGVFQVPAVATIREASRLREALIEALGRGGRAVVDCSKVELADLSLVQLIIAARRAAERDGQELRVIIPSSGVVAEVIRDNGVKSAFDGVLT